MKLRSYLYVNILGIVLNKEWTYDSEVQKMIKGYNNNDEDK